MKKYSFVIPCYGSEHTIQCVVKEIFDVISKCGIEDYEIILVNDCSLDNVWDVIKTLSIENDKIRGISLARNFGQHSALMAGYSICTGDYIVSLDDDGQTPLDELYKLIDKIKEGADVVYASYDEIKQKRYRLIGAWVAAKMAEILIGTPKGIRGSSFFIMRSFIKDEILKYQNAYPYLVGLIYRATRNVTFVETKHRERISGTSGYSIKSLFSLWLNGFTAFSSKPLEISAYLGIIMAVIGFISAIVVVIRKLIGIDVLAGWSSLVAIMLFIGGMILISLGLIGEYIGRIYISINNAPQYVIKEKINT